MSARSHGRSFQEGRDALGSLKTLLVGTGNQGGPLRGSDIGADTEAKEGASPGCVCVCVLYARACARARWTPAPPTLTALHGLSLPWWHPGQEEWALLLVTQPTSQRQCLRRVKAATSHPELLPLAWLWAQREDRGPCSDLVHLPQWQACQGHPPFIPHAPLPGL